jgi:hypothetical protein
MPMASGGIHPQRSDCQEEASRYPADLVGRRVLVFEGTSFPGNAIGPRRRDPRLGGPRSPRCWSPPIGTVCRTPTRRSTGEPCAIDGLIRAPLCLIVGAATCRSTTLHNAPERRGRGARGDMGSTATAPRLVIDGTLPRRSRARTLFPAGRDPGCEHCGTRNSLYFGDLHRTDGW